MRLVFDITEEPADDVYRQLLSECAKLSATALLVIREPARLNEPGNLLLEALSPWVISSEQLSEWPGTRLLTRKASVQQYTLVPHVLTKLQTTVRRLYEWEEPDLPEDPCLLRADSSPVLVTIAHERDSFLQVTEREAEGLAVAIPRLKLMRRNVTNDVL